MKIKLKGGATMQNGQIAVPGSRPNSAPKGLARDGKPKNFQIANRDHGVHASDIAKGVIGGHRGHHPDASAGHGVPVHSGMMHSHKGTMVAGISRTQAHDPQDDARLATKTQGHV
ncbi:hypothetical protein [Bradyrhizobium erythrophlei]|uniref:Uncharacterized protein n=1 Tax=Bradyrhizobium erythrophlei TaxID=1437360 RepID=A0A1M5H3G6_9BRAD|nr:hypothetical protein [Bradyrhizobium erythrophlei]SHG10446.1 hypothetical protein SAMN05443248_0299 [Bradyrhizobium erythrophlei]